jgi:hypothetical protein
MFQVQGRILELQLQHRHSDGSWADMEAAEHDSASGDPEREWANGEIFICKACGEEVQVSHAADQPYSGAFD